MESPSKKKNEILDDKKPKASPSKANDKAKTPYSKEAKVSKSSSSISFVLLPLLVAILGGVWHSFGDEIVSQLNGKSSITERTLTEATNEPNTYVDKYASELIRIQTQKLLSKSSSNAKECSHINPVKEDLIHIKQINLKELQSKNQVFLMLNGQNEGLLFPFDTTKCFYEFITHASLVLGIDSHLIPNGLKLMTQEGKPILNAKELVSHGKRVAHILFDGQIWVWPGIEVGHTMVVDNKWKITTHSLRPKVFSIEGFFNEQEAQQIMKEGIDHLQRSPVDSPDAVDGYHSDRTSFTAFLDDTNFTRDFRMRTAQLARLPSGSFVERLQLVRYQKGQFFRKHEDYFDSKQFLPTKEMALEEFQKWTQWAASKLDKMENKNQIPQEFEPKKGVLYPNFDNKIEFQHAILELFMKEAKQTDFFHQHADLEWEKWIEENLETKANDIMAPLLQDKGYMLPFIIKAWEKKIDDPSFQYIFPKRPVSGVTHYFRWIRWVKEKIQDLLDEGKAEELPKEILPTGDEYPTYHQKFQNYLVKRMFKHFTKEQVESTIGVEWTTWLMENQKAKDVLLEALKVSDKVFDLAIEAWIVHAGKKFFQYEKPKYVQHFEPNRFVTVFLYLNECPEGGETVFPYSKERLVTGINREGMAECSEGLALPPTKLKAAMFYSQTPENLLDPSSLHGGCPPAEGVKFGSNSFAWNADSDEGANAWDLGEDLKTYQNDIY